MSLTKLTDNIRFLLDENVPRVISSFLTQKGFDVTHVPKGLKNGNVIRLSKNEQRILITQDTDFAQPALHPTSQIHSIIIFRIHPPHPIKLIASLDAFLVSVDTITGNRFLLDEHGYSVIEE